MPSETNNLDLDSTPVPVANTPPNSPKQSTKKARPPNSPRKLSTKELRQTNKNGASNGTKAPAAALGDDDISSSDIECVVGEIMYDIAASESAASAEDQQLKLQTHGGKVAAASLPTPRAQRKSNNNDTELANSSLSNNTPPSTKPPSLKPRKSEDDIDIENIPTLDSITKDMWMLYTDLQKCRIVMHYHYSSIPRFERYVLKMNHQEMELNDSPPWQLFSPDYQCAQIGYYIIKFQYTNGKCLLVTGISFGCNHLRSNQESREGIRRRISTAHSYHGAAGEVIIIEGSMRGCLRSFEEINKMHYRSRRPAGSNSGTETYLCSNNEDADTMANEILRRGRSFKASGKLRIPACCSNPTGETISLDPEANDFYKNNKSAMAETFTTRERKKIY